MAGNFFSTGAPALTPAQPEAEVRMNLFFNFGKTGAGILSEADVVVLAVYDLGQYLAHQAGLPGGFKEIDRTFFDGRQSQFPGALQDHTVRAGTGLLYLAKVQFRRKTTRIGDTWFIDQFAQEEAPSNPAFSLQLVAQSAVEEDGTPLASKVVDLRVFATGGPDRGDYDAFTKHGATKRDYTVRLLSSNSAKVLLSQLNPAHCPMIVPVKITYDKTGSKRTVGGGATAPKAAPAVASVKSPLDLTGFYVQEADPTDAKKDPFEILSPGGLYIHHVGRMACGWYYPVPPQVLAVRKPDTGNGSASLFPADIGNKIFSTNRMAFYVDTQKNATEFNLQAFFSAGRGVDPEMLMATRDDPTGALPPGVTPGPVKGPLIPFDQRAQNMTMAFRFADSPFGRFVAAVAITFDARGPIVFRRVWDEPRLAWSTVNIIGQDNVIPAAKQLDFFESLVEGMVEPLPPGTMGALLALATSKEMHDLAIQQTQADPNILSDPINLLVEGQANKGLSDIANALRTVRSTSTVPDDLVAQVRSNLRHDFITINGNSRDMMGVLEEMAGRILTRRLASQLGVALLPPGRPNEQDIAQLIGSLGSSFDGFAAFRIIPSKTFTYKFSFTKVTGKDASALLIFKGSLGGFLVTISKVDATGKDVDPANFPPTSFLGAFAAGGIGRSITLDVGGVSGGAAGGGGPTDVDVTTFIDIKTPAELQNARFTFFAAVSPGASITGGPGIGLKVGASDTVFSITLPNHVPPATLEAEIKSGFQLKGSTPDLDALQKYARKVAAEIKKGGDNLPFAQANATLFSITLCGGILLIRTTAEVPRPGIDDNGVIESLLDVPLDANVRVLGAHFPQGSAELSNKARIELELKLAVLRKVLEYPGWMDIEGTASPEWSAAVRDPTQAQKNNLDLSQFRAQAVRDAILAATGAPGSGPIPKEKDIRVVGKGSKPFAPLFVQSNPAAGQHLDPFANPGNPAVKDDQKTFYPKLRRVDIAMNGVFTVRISGD